VGGGAYSVKHGDFFLGLVGGIMELYNVVNLLVFGLLGFLIGDLFWFMVVEPVLEKFLKWKRK